MGIDWDKLNELPFWLIFIPIGLLLFAIFLSAYLAEYRAGRWERIKSEKTIIDKDDAEEGLLGCGLISLFAAFIIGTKSDLPYPVAILLGLPVGLVVCLALAYVFYLFQRVCIFIIERFFIKRS